MKNLKDLTPQECIKIASIVEPNVDWKIIQSKYVWDGFDLIEKGDDESISKYIFQIDYRSDEMVGSKSRFRFYKDLYQYNIDDTEMKQILIYLETL
jgi:hypothetical protein